jgi:hypothetical protein
MPRIKINENYFEVIDTEDKAYWLGFLYADGCISQDHRHIIVSLSPVDYEHLVMLNNCMDSEYTIKFMDDNRYITLNIARKKIAEDLIDKGCVPAKSLILQFPTEDKLPKELQRHFIRGYFDGDGCISTKLRTKKNRPNPIMECEVNFLGTRNMLEHIADIIPVENIKVIEFGKIYKFRIHNKKDIIKLMDYLYEDSSFYLQRKFDKYQNNIKNYITPRHPLK